MPPAPPQYRFAVIACSKCRKPWSIETRHRTARCPRCGHVYKTEARRPLWQGNDARHAQVAAAEAARQLEGGGPRG